MKRFIKFNSTTGQLEKLVYRIAVNLINEEEVLCQ
jgi:hypothetical protein